MSTSTQQGLNFRPRTYFLLDAEKAVLSRIKGKARRAAVRSLEISHVDASMAAESLSDDEREAVGRVHPSLMGGEYLPDREDGEVEIARFELESVTADVISLRARLADGKIHYRLVDEYETLYCLTPASSDTPLTFGELVELINTIQREGERWFQALREANNRHFIRVSSEYYPQLATHFEAEAEHLAEPDTEPAATGAGVPPTEDVAAQALFARGEQLYDAEDFAKAKECFEQAAELGYGPAQSSFAYMLATGPQDYEKARHWWKRAANQGDVDAQLNLGKLYLRGHGVSQNFTTARQWFGKAAKQGDVEARACLGWIKDMGIGYDN